MDIKIRTQFKEFLIDCTHKDIGLYAQMGSLNNIVAFGNKLQVLGKYETEKRAEEILNSIQIAIEDGFKRQSNGIIIEMPEK